MNTMTESINDKESTSKVGKKDNTIKDEIKEECGEWLYEDKIYNLPEGCTSKTMYGFVYQIQDRTSGKKYIGKKFFWARKTRQVKGKKKKYLGESDWRGYYGSSERLLLEVNKDKSRFKREILRLCKTKSECAYFEAKLQFEHDVLLKDEYYNDWIMVKVRAAHLKKLKETLDINDEL
jgi:hypothetical protein